MPRHKEIGSRADLKEKKLQAVKSKEGLVKFYNILISKLDNGECLKPEEIRFFKKYDELIASAEAREKNVSETMDTLPEGKLKEFIDMLLWQRSITKESPDVVMDVTGYYRCSQCGELHCKDCSSKCIWLQYKDLMKSNVESDNIEVEEAEESILAEADKEDGLR